MRPTLSHIFHWLTSVAITLALYIGLLATTSIPATVAAAESNTSELAEKLRGVTTEALPEPMRQTVAEMLPGNLDERLLEANRRSSAEWQAVGTRVQWDRLRDEKLRSLREAIGPSPETQDDLKLQVSGTVEGEGYRVKNLVFQSRPGMWVTANLYVPAEADASMPGLLICHSHHTPKEHGELQDMGMTWARKGCVVLVPDMLGHGERRQHPFVTSADFHQPYRVGRQDYYFRYDVGMQLQLAGDTLMGWFVWDLHRGVSVLLAQPGVDSKRIIMLGAVAGGGDPVAVATALDDRIRGAVVFNFGGAQPESPYPLPEDAETTFNYAGRGSFESTRNLSRSAGDGFLPWVIVAATAPRPLIYAHEFAWDRPHDPVWRRLQRIWGLHDGADQLAATHGRGSVKGTRPESTHCTHIGPPHRRSIHPLFLRWFEIPVGEADEYSERLDPEKLRCMTPELGPHLAPKRVCDLLPQIASLRIAGARARREGLSPTARRDQLRREWSSLLGLSEALARPKVRAVVEYDQPIEGVQIERLVLDVEHGIVLPMVLLVPETQDQRRLPVVVAVAQAGKKEFLKHRADLIAELLTGGAAVCLPDLRGLGETMPNGSRELWGSITSQSSTELMLGGTLVGARLCDLRSVLEYLRSRGDLDAQRIALWGDSFAQTNSPETDFRVPRHVDNRPRWSEPLGGLLALLGTLFEENICAVYVRGGLSDFHSILSHPSVFIPHDVVIPGILKTGDVPDLAAALAPQPLRLDDLVDEFNRLSTADRARAVYQPAVRSYHDAGADDKLVIQEATIPASRWLLEQYRDR